MATLDDLSAALKVLGTDDAKDAQRNSLVRVDIANLQKDFPNLQKAIDFAGDAPDTAAAQLIQARMQTIQTHAQTLVDDLVKQTKATEADVSHRVKGAGEALDSVAAIMKKADPSKDIADMSDIELRKNFAKVIADAVSADHPGVNLDVAALAKPQSQSAGGPNPPPLQQAPNGKPTVESMAQQVGAVDRDLAATLGDLSQLLKAEKLTGQARTDAIQQIENDMQNRAAKENFGAVLNPHRQQDIQAAIQFLEKAKTDPNAAKTAEAVLGAVARDEFLKAGEYAEWAVTHGDANAQAQAQKVLDGIKAMPDGENLTRFLNADAKAAQNVGGFDRIGWGSGESTSRANAGGNFVKQLNDAIKDSKEMLGIPIAQNTDPSVQAPVVAQVQSTTRDRAG